LIHDLLMQPNDRFRADTPLSPFLFVVGKHTMIASDGADHRRQRGAVRHTFGRRRLNRWIPMIVERTDAAVNAVLADNLDQAPTDMCPVGRRLLIEIVVRASFGLRPVDRTAEIDTRFARSQQYLSSPLYRQIPHPLPFTRRAGVRHDRRALDATIDTAIADSRTVPRRAPDPTAATCSTHSCMTATSPTPRSAIRSRH
jgi:cytochrome P450